MPSLFSKRSRSLSTTRPAPPASNSAHLAAAQAFLASQPSHSNLSASAAATALRTMSPPPQPVDQIQTKRMLNRQASNSSVGNANAPRGRSRGGLQRRTSSGSMTERTFRSPSPASSGLQPRSGAALPPVPAVPQAYSEDLPPVPTARNRRSASVDTPPRVASPRMTASSASRPMGRGQMVSQNSNASSAATAAARKMVNAPPLTSPSTQLQRTDSQESRNSYNFSYPRGSRPNSPPPRPPVVGAAEAGTAPAANGISASETARIQQQLAQTAAKPVKKKKQRVDPSVVQGSHLHSGTMGAGKPTVTPLEPLPADYEPPSSTQPAQKPKKKAALTGESSHFPEDLHSSVGTGAVSDSDTASESPKDKRALRASGALAKQPSIVREDWEGEQEDQGSSPIDDAETNMNRPETITTPVQPKKATPEANMSRKIEEPASTTTKILPSKGESVPQSNVGAVKAPKAVRLTPSESQGDRVASVSPSRSTRFSDRLASDLSSGRKHEPLGRSMSPAKSALKQSSTSDASSPYDPRFPGRRGSSVTPSEASDVSTDGVSATRRKSAARVSFEEPMDGKDVPADSRSSKDSTKKTFGGFGKGKASNLGTITADGEEMDDVMKPRPALPSFGSVRRSDRSASPSAKASSQTSHPGAYTKSASSSESSSIADPPTMDTSVSSDHALGGLLHKETQKENMNDHRAADRAVVSSNADGIDRTGYESDTDSVYSQEDEKPFHAVQAASRELGKTVGSEEHLSPYSDEIPVIAVQPATPGLDEALAGNEWGVITPKEVPVSGFQSKGIAEEDDDSQAGVSTPVKDTSEGLARSPSGYSSWESGNSPSSQLLPIAEEDSDDMFSDAAEDISDLEGDGFGSINAIVESPITAKQQKRVISPPETPVPKQSQQRPSNNGRTASWDDTQAHWSGLAQRVREDNQTSAKTGSTSSSTPFNRAVTENASAERKAPVKEVKTKPVSLPTAQAPVQSSATNVVATKRVSPPTKGQGQMKSSMRDRAQPTSATTAQGPLRSSMRDGTGTATATSTSQGHLRSSMRDGAGTPVAARKERPHSYAGPPSPPHAAIQKKKTPASPAAAPRVPDRRFSNDSDSDSSFRKARRNRKQDDGRYTMKRSMRAGPSEIERPSASAARAGVRSMSPPVDRRPTSPMGGRTFRSSMRGSTDSTPSLRPQPEAKRSSSLFSRNRRAKSPPRPSSAIATMSSKMKSRIVDSDDEDQPRPTHFKSRFANSSDEDEPTAFRPVRGIPKKKDEGDSTDLDDSSDDQGRRTKPNQKKLAIVPPPLSQDVVSPPASPTTGKKPGFWGRLRGKKKEEEAEVEPVAPQTIAQREGIKDDIEAGKKQTGDAKQLGFNSAAERDALVEQTRLKLEAAKEKERPQSPAGKLQRRMTPQRVFSDSFAPPKMPAAMDERPQTSDGVEEFSRPGIGSRQATSEQINGEGVISSKTGKKKKFGFLRKAFRLND